MAIGIRAKLPGVTQEQFDAMDKAVGEEPPDGLIFHASGPVDGGWGILDFWESREQFDAFIAERVAPAMAASGAAPPDVREFPVHEYLKPPAGDAAANKTLVLRVFQEGMNEQRDGTFDELLAADYVNHDMPAPAPGPAGFREVMGAFWSAFPDGRVEVEEVVAEGNLVATRGAFTGTHKGDFMGVPASGQQIHVPYMDFWRVEDGKAHENWVRLDFAALMRQIGATPPEG